MAMKHVFGVLCVIFIVKCHKYDANRLNVSVYYETLCPHSIEYFVEQVYPTWLNLGGEFNLQLIPYGFSRQIINTTNNKLEMTCHHGSNECFAHKIQGCILENKAMTFNQKFNLLNCIMIDYNPDIDFEECAFVLKISEKVNIEMCSEGIEGDLILAKYAQKTLSLNPSLKFVPLTIFDERYNYEYNRAARKNLTEIICRLSLNKPSSCT